MQRILLVIPISAAAIAGAVGYKLSRPSDSNAGADSAPVSTAVSTGSPSFRESPWAGVRNAPLFQLYDEHSQVVRLARSIGRQKLLVVFFDGRRGPDRSSLLQAVRAEFGKIYAAGAVVMAISAARPAEHRQGIERDGSFPFPMLSDLDFQVHIRWGAYNSQSGKPREGVFIVDRAGLIRHTHLGPEGLGTAEEWAAELRQVR